MSTPKITVHIKQRRTQSRVSARYKLSRRSVELLKKAYIEARYSEQYEITEDELQWLAERVTVLTTLTARLCVDHIQQL
jgi:predicted transcriptional regulator